ncbi:hypothetical protein [Domibacillus iocasae]|uniref:Phage protein n=1 Tax=Domibacillus iocasae TaxID=1714016 RepID=A0A1E7DQ80_9BACI|nr:hypothetical protein [Domibacillus iocasae]OES45247.1 hypothetical protein BA724_04355 [Domibacillus iocasae]
MKTMKEQLQQWKNTNPMPVEKKKTQKQKPKKKQPAKQPESFTERDMKYLMNTSMKTLRRGRGGAYK